MARRRAAVVEEALDHAVAVVTEAGVGALTVSEVARRTGMRGPSLYKYFPSLHALYDALFARGVASMDAAVRSAAEEAAPGVERLRAGTRAFVRWCTLNPALAQLMLWRPVPGFRPSPETFAASVATVAQVRVQLTEAVRLRQLAPGADGDDALRTFTVLLSGLVSQQLANEPGVPFEDGSFSRLTDDVLEMFLAHHRFRRRT
ncbi:TetR/AcrR family transcriptional regulator [Kineococcus sp. NUM-3379]